MTYVSSPGVAKLKDDIIQLREQIVQSFSKLGGILDNINDLISNGEIDLSQQVIDNSIWVELGNFFYNLEDYSLAIETYDRMLNTIKMSGSNLHKGLALYNLGISQLRSGDPDAGIPNILEALAEDKKNFQQLGNKPANVVTSNIMNFSSVSIGQNYIGNFSASLPRFSASLNLHRLLSKLNQDEQLLLSKTMLSSTKTKFRNDTYTKFILLNNLSSIILLCETYQKRINPNFDSLNKSVDRFRQEQWSHIYRSNSSAYTHYTSTKDFEKHLRDISQNSFSTNTEENFLVRIFLRTVLVRNYVFHDYNINMSFLQQQGSYEEIFESALHVLIFCLLA